MAIRGRKPKPTAVKIAAGNPGKRPLPVNEPQPDGPIERPEKLKKAIAAIWDRYIARAYWLTWAETPKALMWCHLQHEVETKPAEMQSARIAQWRALGSELGFDSGSRARMAANDPAAAARRVARAQEPNGKAQDQQKGQQPADPAAKYLN